MSDLLPCPFCGGKADIDYDGSVYDGTHVYCTECDIRTESYKTKTGSTWDVDAAIAAWNRRALPAAQPDPREAALRAALDGLLTLVEHANFEEGWCCCGDDMLHHQSPMDCGHTPVDMGEYHASLAIKEARAALKGDSQ